MSETLTTIRGLTPSRCDTEGFPARMQPSRVIDRTPMVGTSGRTGVLIQGFEHGETVPKPVPGAAPLVRRLYPGVLWYRGLGGAAPTLVPELFVPGLLVPWPCPGRENCRCGPVAFFLPGAAPGRASFSFTRQLARSLSAPGSSVQDAAAGGNCAGSCRLSPPTPEPPSRPTDSRLTSVRVR